MPAFNKFNQFVEDLGRKVHNLNDDTLKILLTNTAPAATNATKTDITEIAAGNGYTAGGVALTGVAYAQAAGVGKLAATDPVITASGGAIGPFRYAVLYNDTPTSPADPLIGWWDRGASLTLQDGESWTLDMSDNTQIIALS
jgi:hypothetical protein